MTRRSPLSDRATLVGALVALVAIAPYARTVTFELTYDDHSHIERNAFVQDPGNAVELLPWRYMDHEVPDQGRPVLVASHLLDLALGGGTAAGYHAHSAVWHVFVTLLVLALARRVGLSLRASAASAVLFALHPVHAEAVAGVSNREDILATFFVIATLLSGQRLLSTGRWRWLAALAAAHALALGSKEVAVVAPLLLVLVAVCVPRWRPQPQATRLYAAAAVVFALVTAGWAGFQLQLGYPSLLPGSGGDRLEQAHVVRRLEIASAAAPTSSPAVAAAWRKARAPDARARAEPRADAPPVAPRRPQGRVRLVDALSLEAFRAYQLLVPWPLSPEYELAPLQQPWALALGAAVLAALLGLGAWAWRRGPPMLALGIGWFFVATLPVLVPTLLINPLADRYLYLPAVGSSLLLGWALVGALPSHGHERLGLGLAATLGLAFALLGVRQIGVWRDDVTLFAHAAEQAPGSPRVWVNLGAAQLERGELDAARRCFERAVALDPELHAARHDLGMVAQRLGHPDEAIRHYRRALREPSVIAEQALRDRTLARLAPLMLRHGRRDELVEVLDEELQRRPGSTVARRWRERAQLYRGTASE